eukprot:835566-Amorphochlora_amoeboformis.AAC.1
MLADIRYLRENPGFFTPALGIKSFLDRSAIPQLDPDGVLVPPKRKRGRPKGSKNKRSKAVIESVEESSDTDSDSLDENISIPRDPCSAQLAGERIDCIARRTRRRARKRRKRSAHK